MLSALALPLARADATEDAAGDDAEGDDDDNGEGDEGEDEGDDAGPRSRRGLVSVSRTFSLPYFGFSVIGPNVSIAHGMRLGLMAPGARIRTITNGFGLEVDLTAEVIPRWAALGLGLRLNPIYSVRREHPGGTISVFRFGPSVRAQVHFTTQAGTPNRPAPRFGAGLCIRPGLIARSQGPGPRFTLSAGVCIEAMQWVESYFAGQLEPEIAIGVSW